MTLGRQHLLGIGSLPRRGDRRPRGTSPIRGTSSEWRGAADQPGRPDARSGRRARPRACARASSRARRRHRGRARTTGAARARCRARRGRPRATRSCRTTPAPPTTAANRCWCPSTCSPRRGSRGTHSGTCPASRASMMVPGPPWQTTTDASASRATRRSWVRNSCPSATRGGRVARRAGPGTARRDGGPPPRPPSRTIRSNGWWSVPARATTSGVTGAVPRGVRRGRTPAGSATGRSGAS